MAWSNRLHKQTLCTSFMTASKAAIDVLNSAPADMEVLGPQRGSSLIKKEGGPQKAVHLETKSSTLISSQCPLPRPSPHHCQNRSGKTRWAHDVLLEAAMNEWTKDAFPAEKARYEGEVSHTA